MLHIALFEPEIHPNTGNIARLCAATYTKLHIVGVAGFRLDNRSIKRAGLDYWKHTEIERHIELEDLYTSLPTSRFLYFTTKARKSIVNFSFQQNDCLVFGPETRGLPESIIETNFDNSMSIPMPNPNVRSLNLANSVAISLFFALNSIGDI